MIKPGRISNEIISHGDWPQTLLAAVGEPDIKEKLTKGHKVGDMTYKVHLDGYNFLPDLIGETANGPSESFSRLLMTVPSALGR